MKSGIWNRIKKNLAIVFNLVIVALEIAGFCIAIGGYGLSVFGMYTQDSNLVLLVGSLLYVVGAFLPETEKHPGRTYAFALVRYISACLVAVTFTVVLFCFVPLCVPSVGIGGGLYAMLVREANLYHHLLCPVLSTVSYLVFERDLIPGKKESFFAMLPTLTYAVVSTGLNVAKVVRGPYPFLYVYEQPVWASVLWFFAIPGGGWLFAKFMAFLVRRTGGSGKGKEKSESIEQS